MEIRIGEGNKKGEVLIFLRNFIVLILESYKFRDLGCYRFKGLRKFKFFLGY